MGAVSHCFESGNRIDNTLMQELSRPSENAQTKTQNISIDHFNIERVLG